MLNMVRSCLLFRPTNFLLYGVLLFCCNDLGLAAGDSEATGFCAYTDAGCKAKIQNTIEVCLRALALRRRPSPRRV